MIYQILNEKALCVANILIDSPIRLEYSDIFMRTLISIKTILCIITKSRHFKFFRKIQLQLKWLRFIFQILPESPVFLRKTQEIEKNTGHIKWKNID